MGHSISCPNSPACPRSNVRHCHRRCRVRNRYRSNQHRHRCLTAHLLATQEPRDQRLCLLQAVYAPRPRGHYLPPQ
ncbi:hypothetical protein DL95DRAFT_393085 [Leptodontidium sp. 2 PMI_412]|nr:hypothetical protein DL95DRAFT_393085 [Leptodontidium sp. 2 PMI_412]